MKRMLPVRFGNVRVFDSGAIATRVTARTLRQSLSSMVVDIDLWDENGRIVVAAQNVRLVEAPAELAVDPKSLSYRTASWMLDRPGTPSTLTPGNVDLERPAGKAAALSEALLLVEAGALRASWSALLEDSSPERVDEPASDDDSPWSSYLRSALLWHLEAKNLAAERDGVRTLSATCDLPEIDSIASTLLVRHPTMAAEAASVSRLESIIGRLSKGDPSAVSELGSAHWRNLGVASNQIGWLRDAVTTDVLAAVSRQDGKHLLRLLMVGADHSSTAVDLSARLPNVEIILTDLDEDRLEQAKATIAHEAPLVRCMAWAQLETLAPASLDLAFAIDALSEIACVRDEGLTVLTRLLRPQAPIIAGELAPGIFWDIVRGSRRRWWSRSASTDFPVGALLTDQEWIEELAGAGFTGVSVSAVQGEARIGVIVRGRSGGPADRTASASSEPVIFAWQGETAADLRMATAPGDASRTDRPAPTDFVLAIPASGDGGDPVATLGGHLDDIGELCRRLADAPARLWIVVDFGNDETAPLEQPLWCALVAAARVARNEYPGLHIRCVGLAGKPRQRVVEQAAEEMLAPGKNVNCSSRAGSASSSGSSGAPRRHARWRRLPTG